MLSRKYLCVMTWYWDWDRQQSDNGQDRAGPCTNWSELRLITWWRWRLSSQPVITRQFWVDCDGSESCCPRQSQAGSETGPAPATALSQWESNKQSDAPCFSHILTSTELGATELPSTQCNAMTRQHCDNLYLCRTWAKVKPISQLVAVSGLWCPLVNRENRQKSFTS